MSAFHPIATESQHCSNLKNLQVESYTNDNLCLSGARPGAGIALAVKRRFLFVRSDAIHIDALGCGRSTRNEQLDQP
jgi:hypothetical protein